MTKEDKPKVVHLADRRQEHLGLVGWRSTFNGPVNGSWYDLWVEADGAVVLRVDRSKVVFQADGLRFGKKEEGGEEPFVARGNAYEIRIAPSETDRFRKDMDRVAFSSRKVIEHRKGEDQWWCTPNGDGSYTVKHYRQKAVFEPFQPRMRKGRIQTEEGHRRGQVAPKCDGCQRFVQIGETMYHERRQGNGVYRTFRDIELCSVCILNAPRAGVGEVG